MAVNIPFIRASIDAPSIFEINPKNKTAKLTVRLSLENTSDQSAILHAQFRGAQLFWHLLNDEDVEVCRKAAGKVLPLGRGSRSLTIDAGGQWHETENLTVPTEDLEAGRSYQLRTRFWGQVAETDFVVLAKMPLTKVKPAKKKAPAKKTAAKKTAAKKAPAKKATAKKTKK